MTDEGEWKRSIEEAIHGLNETMQGLQGLQQQQLQQQQQQQVPSHHCTMEDRSADVKKHPQRYNRKEDPITYLMHFEAIANFNGWDEAKKARAIPTYLHAAALQWYTNLDDNTKHSFRVLKDAFIRRYQGANDRQKLEQDFARARYDPSYELEDYADNIEDLGAKLGKSKDESSQHQSTGQKRDAPHGRPSTGYGGRPRWSNPPTYANN